MSNLQEWYRPGEIKFSRRQVIWILSHLHLLKEGVYPPHPQDIGYFSTPIKRNARRSHGTTFERACDIAAEVDTRLKKTGLDGFLAEAIHCWGKSEADLADVFGLTPREISRKVNRALKYASGWRRKNYSYHDYVSHKKVLSINVSGKV